MAFLRSRYSDRGFWRKLGGHAGEAGRDVVEKALWLYYAMKQKKTPAWKKAVIVAALAYLIWPADAVPDVIPVAGYTDDLGALTAALATVGTTVNRAVKLLAARKLAEWFD